MPEYKNYTHSSAWKLTDDQKKFFNEMEAELNVPITVFYGNGRRHQRSASDEGLVFFDYSTNSEDPTPRRIDYISRRNSTTVKLKNTYLLKPDDQREHIFDFNGFPLCEIRMNTLWGLTPLQNFETLELMREFWADAIRMATHESFFKEKEDAKKKKVKDAFLGAIKSANAGEVQQQEQVLRQQAERLAELNEQLVATTTEMIRAEQRKQIAEQLAGDDQTAYEKEIDSLLKHTQLNRIDYNEQNGVLEIYTNLLYIYSPDRKERAPLGEFVIKMNSRKSNAVTLHNLTNQKSEKMHPHVEGNGQACWGATGSQIARLAASCKIEGLMDSCIRYLETYNVQDANAGYARYWFTPTATEKRREDLDGQWLNEASYQDGLKQKEEVIETQKEEVKDVPEPIHESDLQEAIN